MDLSVQMGPTCLCGEQCDRVPELHGLSQDLKPLYLNSQSPAMAILDTHLENVSHAMSDMLLGHATPPHLVPYTH